MLENEISQFFRKKRLTKMGISRIIYYVNWTTKRLSKSSPYAETKFGFALHYLMKGDDHAERMH